MGTEPVRRVSRAEIGLAALLALAFAAKCAVEAGAPRGFLSATLWLAAAGGLIALLTSRGQGRWLDGFRLVLVLVGLTELPSVYGSLGGDGYEYYVYARSPLLDHDLDFANDFAGLHARPPRTGEGEITSRVPIGQGLVWMPFVALAHGGTLIARVFGARVPADGFSPPYVAAVTTATFLLGMVALGLIEGLLRPRIGRAGALLTTLALFYATPLHFYMVANPFMSHGTQAFAGALFVTLWLRAREREDARSWLLAGAAGALMSVVRAQDGVLLIPAALDVLFSGGAGRWSRVLRFVGPPLGAILAQTVVWRTLYGPDFVAAVARLNWVSGSDRNIMGVLFSPRHGLFIWTPLFAIAGLGLLLLLARQPRFALLAMLGAALCVYTNAGLTDWWGSDGFGQRRLLVLLPIFAIGLGEAVALTQRRPLIPVAFGFAVLGFWSLQLQYIYNSELVAGKNEAVTLDLLMPAQVNVLYRSLLRSQADWPVSLWVIAYNNLSGFWLDEEPRSLGGRLDLGGQFNDPLFRPVGDGWFPPEREGDIGFRCVRGRRAWLRIPVRSPADRMVTLRIRGEFDAPSPLEVAIEWNGVSSPEQQLGREWTDLRFDIPAAVMRTGFNDVAIVFSAAPRGVLTGYSGRNTPAAVASLTAEQARRTP